MALCTLAVLLGMISVIAANCTAFEPTAATVHGTSSLNCVVTCTGDLVDFRVQMETIQKKCCPGKPLNVTLEYCSLSNDTIPDNFFSGAFTIGKLTIHHCNLTYFEGAVFNQPAFEKLHSLTLEDTEFMKLDEKTFMGLKDIKYFKLHNLCSYGFSGNSFLAPMATSLKEAVLLLQHGFINPTNWLAGNELTALTKVDLSGNNFKTALTNKTFENMVQLQQLILFNCSIDAIDVGTFDALMGTLRHLDLRVNRLKSLDWYFLINLARPDFMLELQGNEWDCSCKNFDLIIAAKASSINFLDTLLCASPPMWKDVALQYVLTMACERDNSAAVEKIYSIEYAYFLQTIAESEVTATREADVGRDETTSAQEKSTSSRTQITLRIPKIVPITRTSATNPGYTTAAPHTTTLTGKHRVPITIFGAEATSETPMTTSTPEYGSGNTTETSPTTSMAIPTTTTEYSTSIDSSQIPTTTTDAGPEAISETPMTTTTTIPVGPATIPEPTTSRVATTTTFPKDPSSTTTKPTTSRPITPTPSWTGSTESSKGPTTTTFSLVPTTTTEPGTSRPTTMTTPTPPWTGTTPTPPWTGTTPTTSWTGTTESPKGPTTTTFSLVPTATTEPGTSTTSTEDPKVPTTPTPTWSGTSESSTSSLTTNTQRPPTTKKPLTEIRCSVPGKDDYNPNVLKADALFNVESISPTSVRLIGDQKLLEENMSILYFLPEDAELSEKAASKVCDSTQTNVECVIQDLGSNKSYVFCLRKNIGESISPFNCRSHFLEPATTKAWLLKSELPVFVSVAVLVSIICMVLGLVLTYWILRVRPTLLRGSKRVKRVSANSQTVLLYPKKSSSVKEHPYEVRKSTRKRILSSEATYVNSEPSGSRKLADLRDYWAPLEQAPDVPTRRRSQNSKNSVSTQSTVALVHMPDNECMEHYEELF